MATQTIPKRKKADWTPKSSRVEFQLLGTGTLSMQAGRNKDNVTVWFDHKKAKAMGKPDEYVVRYANGNIIQGGRIRWQNGIRGINFKRTEEAIIEALYYAPECQNGPNANSYLAKYKFVDADADKVAAYEAYEKEKNATVLFANIGADSIRDLSVILGYNEEDYLTCEMNLSNYSKKFPDEFVNFFKPYSEGERPELKEGLKIQAILLRAAKKGVVDTKVGAYYFNEDMIGSDLENAVKNLMSTDKSGKAFMIPLILEGMKKK